MYIMYINIFIHLSMAASVRTLCPWCMNPVDLSTAGPGYESSSMETIYIQNASCEDVLGMHLVMENKPYLPFILGNEKEN